MFEIKELISFIAVSQLLVKILFNDEKLIRSTSLDEFHETS